MHVYMQGSHSQATKAPHTPTHGGATETASGNQSGRDGETKRRGGGGGGVEGSRVAFVALRRWNGSRKGYVYKKGARGLGYYLDRQPLKKARK